MTPTNDKLREALFDVQPQFEEVGLEPSLREIVRKYYGEHFPSSIAQIHTESYFAALNPPTESVKAPEGVTQYGTRLPDAWDAYIKELVGWQDVNNWARLPATFRWSDFYDRLLAASPIPIKADDAVAKERERYLRALLIAAPSHQGGHSATGDAIAEALGVPFPVSMPSLRAAAIDSGFMPYDLWPWLERMEADRAAIRSLSPDTEGEGM